MRPVKAEYDPPVCWWLTLPTSASLSEERYFLVLDGVRDINGNKLSAKERHRFTV